MTEPITIEAIQEIAKTILSPAVLVNFAGVLLSLLASYCPKFREWFAGKGEVYKPLFMLVMITLVTVAVGILSFTGVMIIVPADSSGVIILVFVWFSALASNQTTYKLSPQLASVRQIKEGLSNNNVG